MEHHDARDARDNFDHSTVDDSTSTAASDSTSTGAGDSTSTGADNSSRSSGFSTATGAGTSMGAKPIPPASPMPDDGGAARQRDTDTDTDTDNVDAPREQGTDPEVVGSRDEPALPVRTDTGQPETAGRLPRESDIEQRLAAAERDPRSDTDALS